MTVVPGPEAGWERAEEYQGGKRNPAFQMSVWEYATRGFRVIGGLDVSLPDLAARLRLDVERGWCDLGTVDAAMFKVRGIDFALSRTEGNPAPDVHVWAAREQEDAEAALDVLLSSLGVGREALTFWGDSDSGYTTQ
ncbi:hypothetical protein [Streptomyces alkaliterrae]|uniref:Uncharacterized protein n=1 Tax=Streptomyces alkaliterrae TaxID=2213162 RepID=A0A5P0YYW1_9ACTN|nr:hypothetical protein [Streptomyces alkaliterrae]MBB1259618.1 hypothetical protein [Streptomyces alkaliterrae]MQS05495.1 hypothetical protein [Streptomyces alkaliterrae]